MWTPSHVKLEWWQVLVFTQNGLSEELHELSDNVMSL
jgi:hypothetical protein